VYECYDEYSSAADGTTLPGIWKLESELLQGVDLTFVTSRALLERRRSFVSAIRLIPNGIPDSFLDESDTLNDPIDGIPHPRIGYVGVIRKPMLISHLRSVFEQHKGWQLVLVGPVRKDAGIVALRHLPNVHIVGPRPFESLPAIMQKLDVGLIPLQINSFTKGIRPLKLAEYLSAGIPVVASKLPELEGMDRLISFSGESAVSLADAIEAALRRGGPEFRLDALEWSRQLTWSKIVKRDVIPALLESRLI
jgi:glycosyltransferase involved in cell wall biosynthesis